MFEHGRDLRDAVRREFSGVAENPQGEHPFPVGRPLAEGLGYPPDLLAGLPSLSVEAFAGVSGVSLFADIPPGARVLDLGCGAGLDTLIAARRAGGAGRVVGVDFSQAMLERARCAAAEIRCANAMFCLAAGESLPLGDETVDILLVNGLFNLNPSRRAIFDEMGRVVRRGGAVYAAELVLREPLSDGTPASRADWFS